MTNSEIIGITQQLLTVGQAGTEGIEDLLNSTEACSKKIQDLIEKHKLIGATAEVKAALEVAHEAISALNRAAGTWNKMNKELAIIADSVISKSTAVERHADN